MAETEHTLGLLRTVGKPVKKEIRCKVFFGRGGGGGGLCDRIAFLRVLDVDK